MRIEDLTPGMSLTGLEPTAVATIVALVPIAEGAVQVIYKTPDGTLKDRLLGRADEADIAVATQECPWAFDGSGAMNFLKNSALNSASFPRNSKPPRPAANPLRTTTTSSSGSIRCRATRISKKSFASLPGIWSCSTKPTNSPPTSMAVKKTTQRFETDSDHQCHATKALQHTLQRENTAVFKQAYQARAGVEGTISQAVRVTDVRHSRYSGQAKAHFQNPASAAALNVIRVGNWFLESPRAQTRRSAFVALKPKAA